MGKIKHGKSSHDDLPRKELNRNDSVTRSSRARSRSTSAVVPNSITPIARPRADTRGSTPYSQSTSLKSSQGLPTVTTTGTGLPEQFRSSIEGSIQLAKVQDKSNDSNGFFSSIFNAAHNAANMITSTDGKQPKISETSFDERDEKNTSFSHKLDFLLRPTGFNKNTSSSSISKKSTLKSDLLMENETREPDGDHYLEHDHNLSVSNVHFDAVRNSPINTLGEGDLTLDHFENTQVSHRPVTPNHLSDRLIPHEAMKRNLSSDHVHRQLPLSNELSVSGTNDNKRIRRKSIGNGTSVDRGKSPESERERNIYIDDHEALGSEIESNERGSLNSDNEDLSHILDRSMIRLASAKRNKEFHQVFKRLPSNENLIDDFGCALSKDILVQGRMYLSEHYICFNSNILGWVTNIMIPLQEVIQIEKKSTAVLFPNGMIIRTLYHKYVFATFLSRDSTFILITNVWHGVLLGSDSDTNINGNKKRSALYAASKNDTREELLDNGYAGDSISDTSKKRYEEEVSDLDAYLDESSLDELLEKTDDDIKEVKSDPESDTNNSPLRNDSGADAGMGNTNESSGSFQGLPITGPATHAPTDIDYNKLSDETFIADEVIRAPLGVIFLMLFGADNSKFLKILKTQKNYDISESDITELSPNSKERNYTYTKPLNGPIGPKKTKCQIQDKLVEYDMERYILVEQITTTPDVPSGNSFQIKTKIFLSWAENNSTRLYILTVVEWSGRSWIKGAIEKGSIDGQKESTRTMIDVINRTIKPGDVGAPKTDKKRKKRKKSGASTKQAEEIKATPEKNPLENLQQFVEAVGQKVPIPYLGDLISGILLIAVGLLIFFELYSRVFHGHSNKAFDLSNFRVISQDSVVSKIKVNDKKYFVIPSVESYFQDNQSKLQNEVALWKWVNERSDGALNIHSQDQESNSPYPYSNQEIKEVVRIVQLKLDEIKNRIE